MINRRHLSGIVPLAATLLLAGCAADSQMEQGQTADGLRAIRLTATVGDGARADTRAATGIQSAQFDQGETFYAYFPSGVSVGNVSAQSGTTFTTTNTSGATNPTTQPYFNAGVSNVSVHAYYGKSGGSGGTQVTNSTGSFSVALDQKNDQTGKDNYKASDLMYATTTVSVDKSSQTSATGSLNFSHKMSKIIVRANLGNGISSVTDVRIIGGTKTVAIDNRTTTAEYSSDYLGVASTAAADQLSDADGSRIILYSGSYTNTSAALECAALIPPQTIDGSFLQVVTSEGTATYSLASKTFASGESYTYSITVNAAAINTNTTITDWTAAGTTPLVNNGTATLSSCSGISLADATVGMVVCEHGNAHEATTGSLSCGGNRVAVVGYKDGSSGYALALVDALQQTIDDLTNEGTIYDVDIVLADEKRGNVPEAPAGLTWKVLTKENYEKIFLAMGADTPSAEDYEWYGGVPFDGGGHFQYNLRTWGGSMSAELNNDWYLSSSLGDTENDQYWTFYSQGWQLDNRENESEFDIRPALAW